MSQEWKPIETAPRDGTRILVVFPNLTRAKKKWGIARIAKWDGKQWHLLSGGWDAARHFKSNAAQWHPLPALPTF